MTNAIMTEQEFEEWWEGLDEREQDAETAKCYGLNVVAMDWPCGYSPECGDYEANDLPDNPLFSAMFDQRGPVYVEKPEDWPPKIDREGERCARVYPVLFYHRDGDAMLSLLDYARTHEPPTWKAAGCAACVGINPQVDCPRKAELHGVQDNEDGLRYWALIWGVEAEGPTGPAAVQKAFVKAHKVRR